MRKKVIIVGGFNEIIELCEEIGFDIIGIIDKNIKWNICGYKVIGEDKDAGSLKSFYKNVPVILSPDSPYIRLRLFEFYSKLGYSFENAISKRARISRSARIGKGTIIQDGVNISANSIIGNFVKLNTNSNIMHDCVIEDYVTVAPNAVVLGRIKIDEGSYIGANSTILPEIKIGKNVIVGAGAVVTKNLLEANTKYVGIPARKI